MKLSKRIKKSRINFIEWKWKQIQINKKDKSIRKVQNEN